MGRYWRGAYLDDRSADMMDEVIRLRPDLPIWPSQGSYSGGVEASAGTHSGGGAIDIAGEDMSQQQRVDTETTMRKVGFAAWIRDPSQSDWPWHLHAIACDCVDLSSAAIDQESDYYAGRNGLANNGPDTGTRAYVGVTWETYQNKKTYQEEEPEMVIIQAQGGNSQTLITGDRAVTLPDATTAKALGDAGIRTAVVSQKGYDYLRDTLTAE